MQKKVKEKPFRQYITPVLLGLRVYRGLILNLCGVKTSFSVDIN